MVEALDPGLIVLSNLFRDQLDRYGELERLADEWAEMVEARPAGLVLNADDPLVADLGRDAELARRPGVTYFGIEDASQALPGLQHAHDAKHCRRCGAPYAYERAFVGHLGHYTCPNCDADRPDARRGRDPDRARRHARLASRGLDPRRAAGAPSPPPRPLQRLQRARGALGGASAWASSRSWPSRASSAPRRPSGGSRPSRSPASRSRSS